MSQVNYPCSQQELYTACRLGWNSCNTYLTDFANFKGKYDAAFIAASLSAVEDAAKIPDLQQRGEEGETQRIILKKIATQGLRNWQKLKSYIGDAFPEALLKPKLESAGQKFYPGADNFNWNSVQALLKSGDDFITNNLTALTANKNMPAGFAATFKTNKDDFAAQYKAFLQSESGAGKETSKKITANNGIYESLTKMFSDGQKIFFEDEEVKKQFVFEHVVVIAGANNPTANSKNKDAKVSNTTSTPVS